MKHISHEIKGLMENWGNLDMEEWGINLIRPLFTSIKLSHNKSLNLTNETIKNNSKLPMMC